jgi:hypothetical protein
MLGLRERFLRSQHAYDYVCTKVAAHGHAEIRNHLPVLLLKFAPGQLAILIMSHLALRSVAAKTRKHTSALDYEFRPVASTGFLVSSAQNKVGKACVNDVAMP